MTDEKILIKATLKISYVVKKTGVKKYILNAMIKKGQLEMYQKDFNKTRYLSWYWLIEAVPFILQRHRYHDDLRQRAMKAIGNSKGDEALFWKEVLDYLKQELE